MSNKLETYLEEISHFLSGRAEREEILSEIRSHILEKAAAEHGGTGDDAVDRAIAAYGAPRRVAERYAEDQPIIAPAYKRYLVRYTTLLFAIHAALTVFAVVFKKDFVIFPFLFMPKLGVIEALMYLPTAFLADLGLVALVLYFVTQSGKEVKLPWPKFGVDLDEVKPPKKGVLARRLGTLAAAIVVLAITDLAVYLYVKYGTVILQLQGSAGPTPVLIPEAGRRISLVIIALLATATLTLLLKVFFSSRWIDVASNVVSLVLFGVLVQQPFDRLFAISLPERAMTSIKYSLKFTFLFIALMITLDLVKNLVRIGRRKLGKAAGKSGT